MIAEPMYQQLLNLSTEERLDLIDALQGSVEHDRGALSLSTAQSAELRSRIQELDTGATELHSWAAVRADAKAACGR